jgi:Domain of unknown function (DUF4279)
MAKIPIMTDIFVNKLDVYPQLCFKNFEIPAENIAQILKLSPTVLYNKGKLTPARRTARHSFWGKEFGKFNISTIDEAIEQSIEFMNDSVVEIREFSKSLNSDDAYLSISYCVENYIPSLFMDRELIRRLCDFGISLSVDVINSVLHDNYCRKLINE